MTTEIIHLIHVGAEILFKACVVYALWGMFRLIKSSNEFNDQLLNNANNSLELSFIASNNIFDLAERVAKLEEGTSKEKDK